MVHVVSFTPVISLSAWLNTGPDKSKSTTTIVDGQSRAIWTSTFSVLRRPEKITIVWLLYPKHWIVVDSSLRFGSHRRQVYVGQQTTIPRVAGEEAEEFEEFRALPCWDSYPVDQRLLVVPKSRWLSFPSLDNLKCFLKQDVAVYTILH